MRIAISVAVGLLVFIAVALPGDRALVQHGVFRACDSVVTLSFSPDGQILASGAGFDNNRVELWDAAQLKHVATLQGHDELVSSVAFSADGLYIASGSRKGTIRIWSAATGLPIQTIAGHVAEIYGLAFCPDTGFLVTADRNGNVRLWIEHEGQFRKKYEIGLERRDDQAEPPLENNWWCGFAMSATGDCIAASNSLGVIKVCLLKERERSTEPEDRDFVFRIDDAARSLAYSPDGKTLAIGGNKKIYLCNASLGHCEPIGVGHQDCVNALAFSPCGKWLYSGSDDGTVRVWDMASGLSIARVLADSRHVYSIAIRPDGQLLAVGGWDGKISLWKVLRP